MKKKIVFVIPNMTGGGTERVISLLADEYVNNGYPVAIMQFAGYEHAYPLDDRIEDFSIAPQSAGNPVVWIKRLFHMRKYFKDNPDCCIFAFCVMGAVFSVISTWGLRKYILVGERNNPDSCNLPRLRNWAYHRADRITFQTEYGIRYFDKWIAKKAVVIPNPIDADQLPERYIGERKKWVCTVGRLHKQKNQMLLLEAFHDFGIEFPEYELHVYGQGELQEELQQKAEQLGISQKVIWHGFSDNVKEEICDSRMFVLSSDYEGISNSMLEAIAMGIPTITTDCPIYGAREYIQDNISGILTPVGDRAALVKAMLRVANDDKFADQLSGNGSRICDQYSVSSIAKKFLQAAELE